MKYSLGDRKVVCKGDYWIAPNATVIGSVVLAMFFPCIASFVILARELGVRDMLKATAIMIVASLFVGGLLNLVL